VGGTDRIEPAPPGGIDGEGGGEGWRGRYLWARGMRLGLQAVSVMGNWLGGRRTLISKSPSVFFETLKKVDLPLTVPWLCILDE